MSEISKNTNEIDFNEIVDELLEVKSEIEVDVADVKLPKKRNSTFWRNLKYCYYNPWRQSEMKTRFQKLAGITLPFVAVVTLPNDLHIELQRLPSWYDVVRYQVCGFKLKIYSLEEIC